MRTKAWGMMLLGMMMVCRYTQGQQDTVVRSGIEASPADSLEASFKPFMHSRVKQGGMKLVLTGVYLAGGYEWICMRGVNRSAFDFRVDWMSFTIRDRRRVKRVAVQEIRVQPVFALQPSVIPGDSAGVFTFGVVPRVIGKRKELVIELRERNGDRVLRMVTRMRRVRKIIKAISNAGYEKGDGRG